MPVCVEGMVFCPLFSNQPVENRWCHEGCALLILIYLMIFFLILNPFYQMTIRLFPYTPTK